MFNGKIFLIWDKAKIELAILFEICWIWKSQFKNSSSLSPTNLKYLFTQSLPILSSISFPIDILQLLGLDTTVMMDYESIPISNPTCIKFIIHNVLQQFFYSFECRWTVKIIKHALKRGRVAHTTATRHDTGSKKRIPLL